MIDIDVNSNLFHNNNINHTNNHKIPKNVVPIKKKMSQQDIEEMILKKLPNVEAKKIKVDLEKLKKLPSILNRAVKLRVNSDINQVVITVIDKDTNRVIKEIPSKELQNLARHLNEIVGLLYDRKI